MSNNTTTVWAKLIPDIVADDGKNFIIESQPEGFNLFNGVGVRIRVALFETNKTAIRNVSDISSLTHFLRKGDGTYVTKVLTGPFPNISTDDWNNKTAWHAEFAYSDVNMALSAGAYKAQVLCNTSDSLAAVDFCCKRDLTILDSGIPTVFTQPDDDPTLFKALLDMVTAKLADYVPYQMPPGRQITMTSGDSVVKRILAVTNDGVNGAQRVDDLEAAQP